MSRDVDAVFTAIERWEQEGLIAAETARTLRAETEESAASGARRVSQYLLAATAGVVLILAAGLFVGWSWPRLDTGARAALLAAPAAPLLGAGRRLETLFRWRPVGNGMQAVGLALFAWAIVYSERAWADGSAGGVVAGAVAAALLALTLSRALGRAASLPSLHFAFALGFAALALDRATTLSGDTVVWILDGALLVALATLARDLRGERDTDRVPRALGLFATAMSAGFVLLTVTALGPLDLDEHSVLPLDVWWLASVWLTVRAIGTDDFGSRREWLGSLLAYQLVLAAPLGLYTVIEALDGSSDAAAALVGGVAAGGFWFGRRETLRRVMGAAAFCFVVAAWYWGVERGGALGAVFALVCAAGALFWISGRTGGSEP